MMELYLKFDSGGQKFFELGLYVLFKDINEKLGELKSINRLGIIKFEVFQNVKSCNSKYSFFFFIFYFY